jgi:hypothetical protein
MACINDIEYEILLSGATLGECEKFIRKNSDEVFHVKGGYKVCDVPLMGSKPIPIGVKGSTMFFVFTKPCFGLFVLKIKDADAEIKRLRSSAKK